MLVTSFVPNRYIRINIKYHAIQQAGTETNLATKIFRKNKTNLFAKEKKNSGIMDIFPPMLLSLCILSTLSMPSLAVTVTGKSDPMNYQGDYADPFHPYCERHIKVASDGKSFHYSGTAVGPKGDAVLRGCSEEEQRLYGSRNGAFDGLIVEAGAKITVGDGIHEGLWEPAHANTKGQKYADVDGIRFDDGNKWVKLASPSDVLTFPDTYRVK